jgi:hypothetical protein
MRWINYLRLSNVAAFFSRGQVNARAFPICEVMRSRRQQAF